MPGNTYAYRVRADKGAAPSAWSNTFTIAIPAVPAAPSGLTATLQAGAAGPEVKLDFTDNATNETGFTIQRNDNGTGWATLTTLPVNAGTGAVTYTDTTVTPGNTYDYQVRAEAAGPGTGLPIVSAWVGPATVVIPAVPAAPSGLTATLQAGAAGPEVRLDWTDNATNETGFTVQRNDGTGWTTIATPAANAVTYTDATVAAGNTYDYRVRADAGPVISSAWSNTATVVIPAVPAAPSGLTATLQAGAAGPEVRLDWTDNATNETGFTVQRNDGTGWTTIATPAANAVTYTDATVAAGNTYDYRVRADNGPVISSAWSNTATVVIPAVPAAPSSLTATLQAGAAGPEVRLDWTDNATNETGFTVQRNDGTGWTTIATPAANAVTYTDATVAAGNTYDYRVRADAGPVISSAWSNTATVVIPAVPAAPSGLTGTLVAGPQASLAWTDNAANETGFTVQRNDNGAGWAPLTTLGANAVTYSDATVVPGHTYDYRVRADNGPVISSAWSNTATVGIPTIPLAPSNVVAVQQIGLQMSVTWTNNATNATGITLERSVNGAAFVGVGGFGPATATYVDPVLIPGNTYAYRVRALNLAGFSAWATSNTVAVPTLAGGADRPGAHHHQDGGGSRLGRSQLDRQRHQRDRLRPPACHRRRDSRPTWSRSRRAANATTYTSSVLHGTTYYYRIQAVNISGVSGWSNTVNVTTVPLTPTNFRSTARTRTSITLAWNDVSSNETGYQIQRRRVGANQLEHRRHDGRQRDHLHRHRAQREHVLRLPHPRPQRHRQLAVVGHDPCDDAPVRRRRQTD